MTIDELADYVVSNFINKSKGKLVSIEDVGDYLKKILSNSYTSEIGIAVRQAVVSHSNVDFFREGDCLNGNAFHYCVGNWLSMKGIYSNPVEAKEKNGMQSWQKNIEDDGRWLD